MTEKKEAERQRPLTQKRLMNSALYYLGRYESSASNLRQFLLRRIAKEKMKGSEIPTDVEKWIEETVLKMCRDGYINDERFAASMVSRYKQAGKSNRYIREKLRQAGIPDEIQINTATAFEEENQDSEMVAARRFVQKKKLGFLRRPEDQASFRKKDLAALARAGFSFETAVKALGKSDEEDEFYDI